ncbi:MAG: Maf family protein [Porticoccaceae bacterium]
MTKAALILASASPRRWELLAQIGVTYRVVAADIDESRGCGEAAEDYVVRLATTKAQTVWERQTDAHLPVLGADTAVVLGDTIFGKPASETAAAAMLSRLAGTRHRVLSAVAMVGVQGCHHRLSETLVDFRPISPAECRRYWATGEPLDKAGGYGIQGFGAVFVESISGSYSGVVGLPLTETYSLLQLYEISCWMGA